SSAHLVNGTLAPGIAGCRSGAAVSKCSSYFITRVSMNTTFVHSQGSLQLHRWPLNQPNNSLQAWDAADELLLLHAQEAIAQFTAQHQRQPALLLINDSFGALSCALSGCPQVQVNDSVLAAKGTLYNRQQNNIADSGLQ